jgi:hypothetical protein
MNSEPISARHFTAVLVTAFLGLMLGLGVDTAFTALNAAAIQAGR